MKKAKGIDTKEELLSALLEEALRHNIHRLPTDFSLEEFRQRYSKKTGIEISRDKASTILKGMQYAPVRLSSREYVWRKENK